MCCEHNSFETLMDDMIEFLSNRMFESYEQWYRNLASLNVCLELL